MRDELIHEIQLARPTLLLEYLNSAPK